MSFYKLLRGNIDYRYMDLTAIRDDLDRSRAERRVTLEK